MNIRIESLSVNGLGPIASIKWQLKDVNLIYGKNEQGKTYLVEFLLRSLFKNAQSTRDLTDSGQVNISGLDNETTSFKPKSKKKIDDFIFSSDCEKPVDLSRLCVVKGGELSFLPYNRDSISKAVLKEYLSDQRTLDGILKDIPVTIQESTWENGQIILKKQMGTTIKEWNAIKQELSDIDERLNDVDESYSLGEVKKMRGELGIVLKTISDQNLARRAYASSIAEQIREREKALEQIPADRLEEVKSMHNKLVDKCDAIEKGQREIKNLEPECENFPWLKTAIEECERRPAAFTGQLGTLFVILSILGITVSTIFAFLGMPIVSLSAGVLSVLFVILFVIQYRSKLRGIGDNVEVTRIFQEYETKFGEKGRSIAALKSKSENLSRKYYGLQTLKDQIKDHKKELSDLENSIKEKLAQLNQVIKNPKDFAQKISSLQKKFDQLTSEIGKLGKVLAATQVQPDEYISESTETPYDPEILKKNQELKLSLDESITEKQGKLDTLKQRICDITKDPISSEWDELINHLREKRDEACLYSKALKAQIGSGILISQVITNMREREDESITRALASPLMRVPIQAITHNYDGVELDGSDLIAYNQTQRYPVSDLSTGAQEQVLLALRIGIASHVLCEQKMFLILDDAFQHSDWERRAWLVDEMMDLSRIGWQIIYFSMDDHIKQLFEERIKPKLKNNYQTFILQS